MPQPLLFMLVALAIAVIARNRLRLPPNFITLLLFSAVVSYSFSKVKITPDSVELFFPPYGFAVLAGWNYSRFMLSTPLALSFVFLSEVIADVTWASQFGGTPSDGILTKIEGVGGAGWYDGIVVIPLAAATLQYYIAYRRTGSLTFNPYQKPLQD